MVRISPSPATIRLAFGTGDVHRDLLTISRQGQRPRDGARRITAVCAMVFSVLLWGSDLADQACGATG
ncbi:hypothetical protein [Rhodococcus opacus]|uniref:hypothetical protein n=1 Tax=Rhodococcus opacus TaxID=37919 RepID=UPI0024757768|nr:hypothetical protein [Rhodococcus opacus]MDH6291364.1 hypothetical protein [Rhodococcus opacus]